MKKLNRRIERKMLVNKLDELFSVSVRLKTKRKYGHLCPFCITSPIEQCFHFVTRAKFATRWDFDNAVGSCKGCNMENEWDPHQYAAWYIAARGPDLFQEVVKRSRQTRPWSNEDLKAKLEEIKKEMEKRDES